MKENHMIISIAAGEAVDKIQQSFMITLNKLEIETFSTWLKKYKNLTANVNLMLGNSKLSH